MRPRLLRLAPAAALALLLAPSPATPVARADDKVLGEATELTDAVRAETTRLLETLKGKPDAPPAEKDLLAARRALVKLGPVVWPVLENAMKLNPPEHVRPHLALCKALIAKKKEPEFEALRARLRKRFMTDDFKGMSTELATFRLGLPDPAKAGKRLPHSVTPSKQGAVTVYRSADASLVVAYGADADPKNPDAPEAAYTDPMAGFLAVIGGKAAPFERQSGKGADTTATAPNGFAWAWATDGAEGQRPGGAGGVAGAAAASGGAGRFERAGTGGAGAPG